MCIVDSDEISRCRIKKKLGSPRGSLGEVLVLEDYWRMALYLARPQREVIWQRYTQHVQSTNEGLDHGRVSIHGQCGRRTRIVRVPVVVYRHLLGWEWHRGFCCRNGNRRSEKAT